MVETATKWSLDRLIEEANKTCGPGTCFTGSMLKRDPPRLPTGVFSVDFSTGGGLPLHGTTCFWGDESGAKTTLAINTMSMVEVLCWECFFPHELCQCSTNALRMRTFWADIEGTLDREWVNSAGVDPEAYVVGLADYGEQYINIADSALQADDCGLVILDSLAALVPASEMEASSEESFVALQTRMITRAVRKLKQRLIRERKREHPCAVLFTNQMRKKIGITFGDPSTMSGGHGLRHEFSLLLRLVKKALSDNDKKKYHDPDRKKELVSRHSFSIRKEKVLTLSGVGEFVIVKEDFPDLDLTKGQIDDYHIVMTYAKDTEIVEKTGKTWSYFDHKAKRLDDIKILWKKKPAQYTLAQMEIVRRVKARLSEVADG